MNPMHRPMLIYNVTFKFNFNLGWIYLVIPYDVVDVPRNLGIP
jgi:hypothetical protein